jgi:hypothetical protein
MMLRTPGTGLTTAAVAGRGLSEGLGLSGDIELLHDAFPPAFGYLNLDVGAGGDLGDNFTPEALRYMVGRHLPDFPWAGMGGQDVLGKC